MIGPRGGSPDDDKRAFDALADEHGKEYEIWVYDGEWGARHEGAAEDDVLTGATAEGLDEAIRADLAARSAR